MTVSPPSETIVPPLIAVVWAGVTAEVVTVGREKVVQAVGLFAWLIQLPLLFTVQVGGLVPPFPQGVRVKLAVTVQLAVIAPVV